MSQIYYVGDQSTVKDNNGTGSFHDALNWLNFRSPGGIIAGTDENDDADGIDIPGNGLAYFDIEIDHRPNNFGGKPPGGDYYGLPNYLYFGDFLDRRVINNDKLVPGGTARPSGVSVASGGYTFDMGSNLPSGESGGLNTDTVRIRRSLDTTAIAADPILTVVGNGVVTSTAVFIGGEEWDEAHEQWVALSGSVILDNHVQWQNDWVVVLTGEQSQLTVSGGSELRSSELTLLDGMARLEGELTQVSVEEFRVLGHGRLEVDDLAALNVTGPGFELVDDQYVQLNYVDGNVLVRNGGLLDSLGALQIGLYADGSISIDKDGQMAVESLILGDRRVDSPPSGELIVSNGGQLLHTGPSLRINRRGRLLVEDEGSINFEDGISINQINLHGEMRVTDGGRVTSRNTFLYVYEDGRLVVEDVATDLTLGRLEVAGKALIDQDANVSIRSVRIGPGGKLHLSASASDGASTVGGLPGSVTVDAGGELRLEDDSDLSSYYQFDVQGTALLQQSGAQFSERVFVGELVTSVTPAVLELSDGSTLISDFQAVLYDSQVTVSSGSVVMNSIGRPGETGYSPSRTASIVGRNAGESATVMVKGEGSLWHSVDGFLTVGFEGQGVLELTDKGAAKSVGGQIARATTAEGRVTIRGAGSQWQVAENLFVGGSDTAAGGMGKLLVEEGGAVYVESELRIWQSGTVELGDTGIITVGGIANDPAPGVLAVGAGGMLSGSGTISGNVVISGGTLAPGASPGVLTIDGDLTLSAGSVLQLELSGVADGLYDQLQVTGDLSLLGTIEFLLVDEFRPTIGDTFHLFDVSNSLDLTNASFATPQGLTIRAIGPGVFQVVAVPEPHWLTAVSIIGCLIGLRRMDRV